MDKIFRFMQTHTVQFNFPTGSDVQETEEGRDKRKKFAPMLAIPILVIGMMVPLAFGALALLAGKALIVSKLALVLAGIIGLKKLLSPNGGGHEAHEVVVSAGHSASGWSRSLEKAHDLAYKAYKNDMALRTNTCDNQRNVHTTCHPSATIAMNGLGDHATINIKQFYRYQFNRPLTDDMKCLVVLMVIGVAWAMPAAEQDSDPNILGSVLGVVKECVDGDVTLCLKEKALRYVETLRSKREITLVDGVTLDSKGSPRSARALEPLPEEPKAREAQVESRLVDGVADFLENYVVQFKLPSSAVEGMRRSLDEARGKKKKIKQLLPLLAIAKLKIMALIPLFLGIIAFAAAKAVVLAKISLLVAGIIALKKLLASKHTETSYEVVAHPHHEEHYASSGHGWGRSIDDAQNMAYSAHIKSD
ncbi:uncharacterized protein LOC114253114 [Bombyx mandarina]|uniref:Uncharacterized protein LOC114253114 n=1 Tax=Bombyx mandarina TaxID=7092 RepID=A0A6J2KMZ2_BOMMA|nr:uncharacterized protein LOC114253114 [Bombyx mandarina]